MYRCQVCRKHTEDIDESPCDDSHVFEPLKIATMHKLEFDGTDRILYCTQSSLKPGVQGVGSWLGVNCIRCRAKYKEEQLVEQSN